MSTGNDDLDRMLEGLDLSATFNMDSITPQDLVLLLITEYRRANALEARLEKLENKVQGIQDQNGLWDGS